MSSPTLRSSLAATLIVALCSPPAALAQRTPVSSTTTRISVPTTTSTPIVLPRVRRGWIPGRCRVPTLQACQSPQSGDPCILAQLDPAHPDSECARLIELDARARVQAAGDPTLHMTPRASGDPSEGESVYTPDPSFPEHQEDALSAGAAAIDRSLVEADPASYASLSSVQRDPYWAFLAYFERHDVEDGIGTCEEYAYQRFWESSVYADAVVRRHLTPRQAWDLAWDDESLPTSIASRHAVYTSWGLSSEDQPLREHVPAGEEARVVGSLFPTDSVPRNAFLGLPGGVAATLQVLLTVPPEGSDPGPLSPQAAAAIERLTDERPYGSTRRDWSLLAHRRAEHALGHTMPHRAPSTYPADATETYGYTDEELEYLQQLQTTFTTLARQLLLLHHPLAPDVDLTGGPAAELREMIDARINPASDLEVLALESSIDALQAELALDIHASFEALSGQAALETAFAPLSAHGGLAYELPGDLPPPEYTPLDSGVTGDLVHQLRAIVREADAWGCFDAESEWTPCDWAPSVFVRQLTERHREPQERAFQLCLAGVEDASSIPPSYVYTVPRTPGYAALGAPEGGQETLPGACGDGYPGFRRLYEGTARTPLAVETLIALLRQEALETQTCVHRGASQRVHDGAPELVGDGGRLLPARHVRSGHEVLGSRSLFALDYGWTTEVDAQSIVVGDSASFSPRARAALDATVYVLNGPGHHLVARGVTSTEAGASIDGSELPVGTYNTVIDEHSYTEGVSGYASLFGIPIRYAAGATGRVGIGVDAGGSAGDFTDAGLLSGRETHAGIRPFASLEGFASVAVSVGVAEVGIKGRLLILEAALPVAATVRVDAVETELLPPHGLPPAGLDEHEEQLSVSWSSALTLTALGGSIAVYGEIDFGLWSEEAEYEVFSWSPRVWTDPLGEGEYSAYVADLRLLRQLGVL